MGGARPLVALATLLAVTVGSVGPAGSDEGELTAARDRANDAAAQLSRAESALAELEVRLASEEARVADAEARVGELRGRLQTVAIEAYTHGAADDGAAFLTGSDINDTVQRDALNRLVTQRDFSAIDQYRVAREDAEVARAALEASRADQETQVEQLREARQELDAELARLEELDRRERAARAAAAGGRSAADAPSTPIATGAWVCPVQGPVAFSDSWGAPRSGGRRHQGSDMLSPRGTPTVAPVSGRVEHRSNSLGGLTWYVYGDDGNTYYGAHLSAYANEGAGQVAAGTIIGYVGDSGNARGTNHLHFQIHPNGGSPVNPYPTIARYC